MKKYLIALAAVLLLAGQATALDPLENFQVENGFDENFYGGDIHEIEANFTNSKNIEVPLYVRLNVTNEDGLTGEEFDVNARINSSNSSGQRITDMSCQPLDEVQYQDGYRSDNNTIIYSCYENGNEIIGNSFNHLQVNATSDSRIVPGDYDFDLRMYSRIGEIENTGNTQGEVGSFSSDRATVSYNAIDEAYITYADYSKIYSSQPQSKFIEAVEVVSSPQSQQPTTCLPYIPDMSMQLFDYVNSDSYFFDRLKCQKADTNITGEVQFNYSGYNPSTTDIYKLENNGWTKLDDSYRNDGTISANVSGFSVYAAFGEEVVGASEDGIVYDSVLPGDPGISVIEMEISSPSKVYIGSNKTLDTDHTCNEPELDAEPGCTPNGDGELDNYFSMDAWIDDGDGVYDPGEQIIENVVSTERLIENPNGTERHFAPGKYYFAFNWSISTDLGNEGQTDRLLYDIYARNETVDQSDDQIQTFDTGGSGDSDSGSISTTSIQQNAAGDDDGEDDEDQNFEEDNDSDTEGGTSENTGNSTDPNSNQDSADQNDLNSTEINGNSSSESENNVTGAFTAQNPGAFGLLLLLILLLSAIGYYRNEIGAQIRSVNPL